MEEERKETEERRVPKVTGVLQGQKAIQDLCLVALQKERRSVVTSVNLTECF